MASCRVASPVLILAGPTGIGKTRLSLLLARTLNAEIISADSVQCYRELNVGSNKIDLNERIVRHHCLDCATIDEKPWSCADWCRAALKAIDDIHKRGKRALVVGGAGFYIQSLIYGQAPTVKPTAEQRAYAEKLLNSGLNDEEIVNKIETSDEGKQYVRTVMQRPSGRNPKRVSRAIEIVMALKNKPPEYVRDGEGVRYDFRAFYLTTDKLWNTQANDWRCELMIQHGLLEEVMALGERLSKSSLADSIGYRQAIDFLSGPRTLFDFRIFLQKMQIATRQYIRQQNSWFRRARIYQFIRVEPPIVDINYPEESFSISMNELMRVQNEIVRIFNMKLADYRQLTENAEHRMQQSVLRQPGSTELVKKINRYQCQSIIFKENAAVEELLSAIKRNS